MACMPTISNPSNGQDVSMPLTVNAGATGTMRPGDGAISNILAASSQLDDGNLTDLACSSGGFGTPGAQFTIPVNGLAADTWHMITLHVWDNQSSTVSTVSVTFHVMSFPPLIP